MRKEPGRYVCVYTNVWRSGSFRALSAMEPSGMGLWLYLITCPNRHPVPGVIVSGSAGLAESLRGDMGSDNWTEETVLALFADLEREKMVVTDWKARLIWLTGGPTYNPPNSPNVARRWAFWFGELPECGLKWLILQHLIAFLDGLPDAFKEAFLDGLTKWFPKGFEHAVSNGMIEGMEDDVPDALPKPMSNKQLTMNNKQGSKNGAIPLSDEAFSVFWQEYPRKVAKDRALKAWKGIKPPVPSIETILQSVAAHKRTRAWTKDDGDFIPHPASWLNGRRWEDEVGPKPKPPKPPDPSLDRVREKARATDAAVPK